MTISNTRVQIKAEFGQNYKDLGTIGRVGENDSRELVFDCADVLAQFPGASIVCVIKRACDTKPYSAALTEDESSRILPLSAVENAAAGQIMIELRAVSNDTVLKSAMFSGRIAESLQGEGDVPGNPTTDALNRLETAIAQAAETSAQLAALVQSVQKMLDDGAFVGPRGPAGVSPTIATSKTGKVTTITITDANGAHRLEVLDGADGQGADIKADLHSAITAQNLFQSIAQALIRSHEAILAAANAVQTIENDEGSDE